MCCVDFAIDFVILAFLFEGGHLGFGEDKSLLDDLGFQRSLKLAKLCRNQILRTPLGDTNTPALRNSLLTRNWPCAG
jgi:hypothetical protein